jgi:hypothetical protein
MKWQHVFSRRRPGGFSVKYCSQCWRGQIENVFKFKKLKTPTAGRSLTLIQRTSETRQISSIIRLPFKDQNKFMSKKTAGVYLESYRTFAFFIPEDNYLRQTSPTSHTLSSVHAIFSVVEFSAPSNGIVAIATPLRLFFVQPVSVRKVSLC